METLPQPENIGIKDSMNCVNFQSILAIQERVLAFLSGRVCNLRVAFGYKSQENHRPIYRFKLLKVKNKVKK